MKEETITSSNKKIAKNTLYLYSRTFFSIIITLYTSRVFLNQLGVEDFGLYNLVGGVVSLFGVLNSMLASATQRYLSVEIGKGKNGNVDKILNISLLIHIGLALAFLLVGEIGGSLLLAFFLNVPEGKLGLAFMVFHISMFTAAVSLLKTPNNALIIAREKMAFYAYMSIFEVFAKLVITLILVCTMSKLIVYSSLLLTVNVVLNICYYYYCKIKIGLPALKFYNIKHTPEYKELLSFSAWTLLGNASSVGRDQGLSFLLNLFFGVVLNATMGIMVQISNVLSSLFLSLQSAFRPQIIQCSVNNKGRYDSLLIRCMFYSLSFMGVVCIPMALCCKFILSLWLGQVPEYTVEFVQLLMIKIIFASVSQSVFIALEANGKIRNVQIGTTIMSGITLVFAYCLLRMGCKPYWVMGATVFMEFSMLVYRVIVAGKYSCLDVRKSLKQIAIPILSAILLLLMAVQLSLYVNSLAMAILGVISIVILYVGIIVLAMNKVERQKIWAMLVRR